jgi:hypothetical protein
LLGILLGFLTNRLYHSGITLCNVFVYIPFSVTFAISLASATNEPCSRLFTSRVVLMHLTKKYPHDPKINIAMGWDLGYQFKAGRNIIYILTLVEIKLQ